MFESEGNGKYPRLTFTPSQISSRRGYVFDDRQEIDLNGPWRFMPDSKDLGEMLGYHMPEYDVGGGWVNTPGSGCWREVSVPCTFDHCGQDTNRYEGIGWFRREFNVPHDWKGKAVILRFEGLNHVAKIWLNGRLIGESPDGHLRAEFDIANYLRFADVNTLIVKVDNTGRIGDLSPGMRLAWFPEGGITRDVNLTAMNLFHIRHVRLKYAIPENCGGRFCLSVVVRNHGGDIAAGRVFVEISDAHGVMQGCYLAETPGIKNGSEAEIIIEDSAPDVLPWSPESPFLYTAQVYLLTDERRVDCTSVRFGFRKIAAKGGRLYLNDQPIFLTGFNRHEDSPRTGMAFDPEIVRQDAERMKSLGANFVRLCHYPHAPAELDVYDELGLMALCEIPLIWWPGLSPDDEVAIQELDAEAFAAKKKAARRQLTKMINRDMNHPSVIFWSVSNEVRVEYPQVIETNKELLQLAKRLDPSRLAVHVSAHWSQMFDRVDRFDCDDVICMNQYPSLAGVPDPAQWWRDETRRLHELYPEKPIVVTEFGYTASHSNAEEMRAKVYETEFSGMDAPYVCGSSIWVWADHPYPEDHLSGPGLRYGICTRDRKMHPAAETVRRMYSERQEQFKKRNGISPKQSVPTYADFLSSAEHIRESLDLAGTWWCQPDPKGPSVPAEHQIAYPRTESANVGAPSGEELGFYEPDFDVTGKDWGSFGRSRWRQVMVPCTYDDCGFDLRQYEGEVWFRRTFTIPKSWKDKRVIIRFEGINWCADIWVNGIKMEKHMDGLLRLDLDISGNAIYGGENVIAIKTDNTYRLGDRSPGTLTGYFPDGGITREVELLSMSRSYLLSSRFLSAEPVGGGGIFNLEASISNQAEEAISGCVVVDITDYSGHVYWSGKQELETLQPRELRRIIYNGRVDDIRAWSPDDPALYVARVSLMRDKTLVDREYTRFGFRKIEIKDGALYLNDELIYLYGTDIHEDSHRTGMAVDLETLRRDVMEMKHTGINFVRLAHAPRGPSALDIYDELGIMVMEENNLHWWMRTWLPYAEVPMQNDGAPGNANFEGTVETAKRQIGKMISRDINHPSIIIWSVGNEIFLDQPGVLKSVKDLIRFTKALDPSRPVAHVSHTYDKDMDEFACDDIICINGYSSEPSIWRSYIEHLHSLYPGKPVLVTEFGYVGILGEHRQAERIERIFKEGMKDECICGGCVYSWVDVPVQSWEVSCPHVNGAYGIASRWREKREAVAIVRRMFKMHKEQKSREDGND